MRKTKQHDWGQTNVPEYASTPDSLVYDLPPQHWEHICYVPIGKDFLFLFFDRVCDQSKERLETGA